MSQSYIHTPSYGPFKGINLATSKQSLSSLYQTTLRNSDYLIGSIAVVPRHGFKRIGGADGTLVGAGSATTLMCSQHLYQDTNITTGIATPKICGFTSYSNNDMFILREVSFTLATASAFSFAAHFKLNTSTQKYEFLLDKAGINILTYVCDSSIGVGNTAKTLTDLMSTINTAFSAAPNLITATLVVGAGTELVSDVLPIFYNQTFTSSSTRTITGEGYTRTAHTNSTSRVGANLLTTEGELISSTNLQNCIYFADGLGDQGFGDVLKYDGQNVYAAGMPTGSFGGAPTSSASATAGSMVTGYYTYAQAYEQTDAKENVIEGLGGDTKAAAGDANYPGPQQVFINNATPKTAADVVVKNLTSGNFNHCHATANAPANITSANSVIAVNGGHSLKVGDNACFRCDLKTAALAFKATLLIESKISAISATSITIGATFTATYLTEAASILSASVIQPRFADLLNVTPANLGTDVLVIANGAPISCGLRINLYRNRGEGITSSALKNYTASYYLVDILVNDAGASTQTYIDKFTDAQLGPLWNQKINLDVNPWPAAYDKPFPNVRYIESHLGRLYGAGDPEAVNRLYRSDVDNVEYFNPTLADTLDLSTPLGDKITGIKGNGKVFNVARERSFAEISGDLSSNTNIRIRDVSKEIGCVAHATMTTLLGSTLWCSQFGPVTCAPGGDITFLGADDSGKKSRIEGAVISLTADLKRANAVVDFKRGAYLLFIPQTANKTLGFANYASASSNPLTNAAFGTIYIYNVLHDSWGTWTELPALGGMIWKKDKLYFLCSVYNTNDSPFNNVSGQIFVENASGTIYDYVDLYQGTAWEWASNWEHLGDPNQLKFFNKLTIQSNETDPLIGTNNQSINVTTEVNYIENVTSSSYLATLSASKNEDIGKLKTVKAKALRVRLASNTLHSRPTISGVPLEAAAPFRPKSISE